MKELIIKALIDFQVFGLKAGDQIKLVFDEETGFYHSGSCTWSPKRIEDEIAIKLWELVDSKVF